MQWMHHFFRLRSWARLFLLPGILVLSLLITGIWFPTPTYAATFTQHILTDHVPVPLFNNADNDIGILQTSSGLWVQATGTIGSAASADHGWTTEWHRYTGTTMDNLVQQSNGILDPTSFTRPYGDDKYWSSGTWQDAQGIWYTPVHVEYSYYAGSDGTISYPHWKRRIGLATSTDQGVHWHYQGDILTYDPLEPKPNPNYYHFGDGDLRLFVDSRAGYFYIYYMTGWTSSTDTYVLQPYMAVARSPISAHMAPGSWTKWYHGSWNQPGLQGLDSEVFPGATTSLSVHYNTYLGTYMMIDNIGPETHLVGRVATATDLSKQNWQTVNTHFPTTLQWYNWPVDPSTQDRYMIGRTFRLYSSANMNVDANGQVMYSKYMLVTLSKHGSYTYEAASDFSTQQGKKQWYYHYTTDETTYTNMRWDSTNKVWSGPESYCWLAAGYEHPGGTTCAASLTWIAPTQGTLTITARNQIITIDTGSGAAGVYIMIKRNGEQLWPQTGWHSIPPGGTQVIPTLTTTVSAGDALHFIVAHAGTTNNFDSTSWDPIITLVSA